MNFEPPSRSALDEAAEACRALGVPPPNDAGGAAAVRSALAALAEAPPRDLTVNSAALHSTLGLIQGSPPGAWVVGDRTAIDPILVALWFTAGVQRSPEAVRLCGEKGPLVACPVYETGGAVGGVVVYTKKADGVLLKWTDAVDAGPLFGGVTSPPTEPSPPTWNGHYVLTDSPRDALVLRSKRYAVFQDDIPVSAGVGNPQRAAAAAQAESGGKVPVVWSRKPSPAAVRLAAALDARIAVTDKTKGVEDPVRWVRTHVIDPAVGWATYLRSHVAKCDPDEAYRFLAAVGRQDAWAAAGRARPVGVRGEGIKVGPFEVIMTGSGWSDARTGEALSDFVLRVKTTRLDYDVVHSTCVVTRGRAEVEFTAPARNVREDPLGWAELALVRAGLDPPSVRPDFAPYLLYAAGIVSPPRTLTK